MIISLVKNMFSSSSTNSVIREVKWLISKSLKLSHVFKLFDFFNAFHAFIVFLSDNLSGFVSTTSESSAFF